MEKERSRTKSSGKINSERREAQRARQKGHIALKFLERQSVQRCGELGDQEVKTRGKNMLNLRVTRTNF